MKNFELESAEMTVSQLNTVISNLEYKLETQNLKAEALKTSLSELGISAEDLENPDLLRNLQDQQDKILAEIERLTQEYKELKESFDNS